MLLPQQLFNDGISNPRGGDFEKYDASNVLFNFPEVGEQVTQTLFKHCVRFNRPATCCVKSILSNLEFAATRPEQHVI
jgi:hypothetical protein